MQRQGWHPIVAAQLSDNDISEDLRMPDDAIRLASMDELRRYVAETLASFELLKADEWRLSQQVLNRSGRPCGVKFCLHGPRSLRLTAIWETEGNSILFYKSCGTRAGRVRIAQSPSLASA
jgi:hypothetical protein